MVTQRLVTRIVLNFTEIMTALFFLPRFGALEEKLRFILFL
jgi:hypothetical protein